jgi:hypothetical protein
MDLRLCSLGFAIVTALLCTLDAQGPRPLGTLILGSPKTNGCPAGFTCTNFTVTCPGISAAASGVMADQKPSGQITGMVMFFSGAQGADWWSGTSTLVPPFFQALLNAGFELLQISWSNGWPLAPGGVESGQEALACRPATVIQWVHDNVYAPLNLRPDVGQCGFCITGESSGADQVSYPITSYGIDSIVNAAIPTSGPELTALSKGCLQVKGYAYDSGKLYLIDESYGFTKGGGPCAAQDQSFTQTWVANSVETGGTSYFYPSTRIQIIVGSDDSTTHLNHALAYFQVLTQAQQPMLTWQSVANMAHGIQDSSPGLSALFTAITGQTYPSPTPTATATPTATPTPSATPTPTATATATPSSTPTPTPRSTPAAPTGLTARAVSSREIDLAWTDNSNNETGFGVQRSTDGKTFTLIASVGANVTVYNDMTVSSSTKYYYRVAATNSAGHSAVSNTASATTPGP